MTRTHTLVIPDWHPAKLNELIGCSWQKRNRAPRQRAGDPDAYLKSTLDALAAAGLLVDDNRQHCELGRVTFDRGPRRRTEIVLEDLAEAITWRQTEARALGRDQVG